MLTFLTDFESIDTCDTCVLFTYQEVKLWLGGFVVRAVASQPRNLFCLEFEAGCHVCSNGAVKWKDRD